jgi:hypothetical protein
MTNCADHLKSRSLKSWSSNGKVKASSTKLVSSQWVLPEYPVKYREKNEKLEPREGKNHFYYTKLVQWIRLTFVWELSTVTPDLGFSGFMWRSRLGCGGSILTQTLTGYNIVNLPLMCIILCHECIHNYKQITRNLE